MAGSAFLLAATLGACATLSQRSVEEARLDALNTALLGSNSATAVLQAWCDVHRPGMRIAAQREMAQGQADGATRAALNAPSDAIVIHRRVRLVCGEELLSVADNWYLPQRLTPEMNRLLDNTQTPFGVAVRGLRYTRRTLSADMLLGRAKSPSPEVLRHRAVLETSDGRPFSLVVETYQRTLLRPARS